MQQRGHAHVPICLRVRVGVNAARARVLTCIGARVLFHVAPGSPLWCTTGQLAQKSSGLIPAYDVEGVPIYNGNTHSWRGRGHSAGMGQPNSWHFRDGFSTNVEMGNGDVVAGELYATVVEYDRSYGGHTGGWPACGVGGLCNCYNALVMGHLQLACNQRFLIFVPNITDTVQDLRGYRTVAVLLGGNNLTVIPDGHFDNIVKMTHLNHR